MGQFDHLINAWNRLSNKILQDVYNKLWVFHIKTRKKYHINICPEMSGLWVIIKKLHSNSTLEFQSTI